MMDEVLWTELCLSCKSDSEPSTRDQSPSSQHNGSPVVRQLLLSFGERLDDVIIAVKKGWTLRFVLAPSLYDSNVRLFVSHQCAGVTAECVPFELTWHRQCSHELYSVSTKVQIFADMEAERAGSFRYFFTVGGTCRPEDMNGSGYFIVQSELRVGSDKMQVPVDAIVCQTVLSKNLGPITSWLDRLIVAKKTGYNAIHFTPLQDLGDSMSAYALRDFFKLNPSFGSNVNFADVAKLVRYLDKTLGMLSFTDLVLNHAANESEWIADNPQCVYNLVNTPHLKPAFLLDCMLARFSDEVAAGLWTEVGLPAAVQTENHLQLIRHVLQEKVEKLRIWEFYQVDIEQALTDIVKQQHSAATGGASSDVRASASLTIVRDAEWRRLASTVDLSAGGKILRGDDAQFHMDDVHSMLQKLNADAELTTRQHLTTAVSNMIHSVWHRFINVNGDRATAVSAGEPLMNRYFRLPVHYAGSSSDDDEALMYCVDTAQYCWVHSGWVCEELIDPLVNFAEPPSNVYLRRELNSWTDSVKLRYGSAPADCPALWARVAKYAALTASVFHGVRLDNCHSTPAHVAEHVLRAARSVRPDLYVFAELYAGREAAACQLSNQLGLNATVEVGLHAHSPWKLAERVGAAGDLCVGALMPRATDWLAGRRRPPTLFYDQTHDDPSPLERRSDLDPVPSAAVVSAAAAAIGSNRGYDELVPQTISVISEKRLYRCWRAEGEGGTADGDVSLVDGETGLVSVKRVLNELHVKLAVDGYDEIATEMIDDNVVMVTRRCATKQRAHVILAHTAFHWPAPSTNDDAESPHAGIPSVLVPGVVSEVCLEASVSTGTCHYQHHPDLIVGLSDYCVQTRLNLPTSDSSLVRVQHHDSAAAAAADDDDDASCDTVELVDFAPGSVVILAVTLDCNAVRVLDTLVQYFNRWIWNWSSELNASSLEQMKTQWSDDELMQSATDADKPSVENAGRLFQQLVEAVLSLSVNEMRRVLYEDETERRPSGDGFTVYHIPGHGDLAHCGLAGVAAVLAEMRRRQVDMARHPLALNVRHGDWLMDYIIGRLGVWPGAVRQLADWLSHVFQLVKSLPRCLVASYFEAVVSAVYALVIAKFGQV